MEDRETVEKGEKVVLEWLKKAPESAREAFFKQLPSEEMRQYWRKKVSGNV